LANAGLGLNLRPMMMTTFTIPKLAGRPRFSHFAPKAGIAAEFGFFPDDSIG
jgi:hypothetical protein